MQLLYNSDSYTVVQFEALSPADGALAHGGYEIVDKFARTETYLSGALAESFERGVHALVQDDPDADTLDEFIAHYTHAATQPLLMH